MIFQEFNSTFAETEDYLFGNNRFKDSYQEKQLITFKAYNPYLSDKKRDGKYSHLKLKESNVEQNSNLDFND